METDYRLAPMDITTYAATAVLPWIVVQSTKYPIGSEADLLPLNFSYITRSSIRFQSDIPKHRDGDGI
jgi:hypothetical protein